MLALDGAARYTGGGRLVRARLSPIRSGPRGSSRNDIALGRVQSSTHSPRMWPFTGKGPGRNVGAFFWARCWAGIKAVLWRRAKFQVGALELF